MADEHDVCGCAVKSDVKLTHMPSSEVSWSIAARRICSSMGRFHLPGCADGESVALAPEGLQQAA